MAYRNNKKSFGIYNFNSMLGVIRRQPPSRRIKKGKKEVWNYKTKKWISNVPF